MKEERGSKILKSRILVLPIVFFLMITFLYSNYTEKFFEVQDFDPSLFYETSIISDDTKLIYWKDGKIFYKDIFKRSAKWKKLQNFYPEDFFIKVEKDKKINLIPIGNITYLHFFKERYLCAFTAGLGTTPNTTVVISDKKKNKVVFTPVLTEKKEKNGVKQIFMERTYFNPVISDDEQYIVCDGFDGYGQRISSLFDINKKSLIKEFKDCAFPYIYRNKVYFLKDNKEIKAVFLSIYDMKNIKENKSEKIIDRIIALKIINDIGFIITDKNIYEFDINNIEKCKKVFDFNDCIKKYQNFNVEQAYACISHGTPYLFIVIKGFKDKYEWKLYCYKIQN